MAEASQAPELSIILVGKTGSGKSATANTILGEEKFATGSSFSSVTRGCERAAGSFRGRGLSVVDTPGYFDPDRDNKKTSETIQAFVKSNPSRGFHAIILVMKLDRFTPEEQKAIDEVQKILRLRARDYTILLFTRKEELKGRTLESAIGTAPQHLQKVVQLCGKRYLAFNNNAVGAEREAQVAGLMELIDKMKPITKDEQYTFEMFKQDSSWFDCCNIL